MKICVRLQKAGYLNNKGSLRKNWIEEVCWDCPLEKLKGYCVYDKEEEISKDDEELLMSGDCPFD